MTVLRTVMDRPIPPADIIERFERVDDRLGLRYVYYAHRDYSNVNMDERWAITLRWAPDDKRRIMIQRGDMAEDSDFDVLAYLPLDCSTEQAFDYFSSAVKGQINGRPDMERLLSRVHLWNDQVAKASVQVETDKAEEQLDMIKPGKRVFVK